MLTWPQASSTPCCARIRLATTRSSISARSTGPPEEIEASGMGCSELTGYRGLFDDRIGAQQERFRYCDPKSLGGLKIDHQFEFGGLLDRHVGRFAALQNLIHEHCAPPE